MPQPNSNSDTGDQNKMDQNAGYSAEYVKSLRDEAASWRTRLRETETEVSNLKQTISKIQLDNTIGEELEKRGLNINPGWINVEEGITPDKAVDKFLKDYPQLAGPTENIVPNRDIPNMNRKPMVPSNTNSNIENTAKHELDAIRKDPIAREKLRGLYRSMLAQNSGSSNYIH